jgi:glycine cleavage system H protein
MSVPGDLKYSKTHEWLRIEGDVATIGITDHAQSELGDIVYVELPEAGRVLAKDDIFGTVESVKAVSDLYSPVGGEVVESNASLADATETVNQDPYEGGWMIRVRLANSAELEELLDGRDYDRLIAEASH